MSSAQASRCVLIWLQASPRVHAVITLCHCTRSPQVFAAVLAVFLSATAVWGFAFSETVCFIEIVAAKEQWLPWTCGKLDLIGGAAMFRYTQYTMWPATTKSCTTILRVKILSKSTSKGLGELGICDCRLSADGCWQCTQITLCRS